MRIRLRPLASGKVTVSWAHMCVTFDSPTAAKTFQEALQRDLKRRTKKKATYSQITGQRGGNARREALSPERRAEISSLAAKARWAKVRQAEEGKP